MADNLGRREETNDPLAITGREQRPARSLDLQGVRPPNNGDANAGRGVVDGINAAFSGLSAVVSDIAVRKKDEFITQGKTDYLSGVTEEEMLKTGNKFTEQGYRGLQSRDMVNEWYTKEAINIDEASKTMEPEAFKKYLGDSRKSILDGITDPGAKKIAVAAFEELSPRLAQSQLVKNSEYNHGQQMIEFGKVVRSSARVNENASRLTPDNPLALTTNPVMPAIVGNDNDRDIGIRTILGEAVNQGTEGMSAVAHVLRNRATDGRWPNTISGVATQNKQFSVWNDGKSPNAIKPGNPLYEKAGKIYDAVMSGRHVDPTGGATHYFSPKLMKIQAGKDRPDWADQTAKERGEITIGDHVFSGKTRNSSTSKMGILEFAHADQKDLNPKFNDALMQTADAMGGKLKITSGHRDASHAVEAAKAKPGTHTDGIAADIDMTGMDDEKRKQLVRELTARGVKRFGTYSTSPNMLHVDMKDQQGDGSRWFMHDKTNTKLANAPAWLQEMSAEAPGDSPLMPRQNGTDVRQLVTGFTSLKNEDKATVLSDEMRRGFDAGDVTMFNDLGGLSILYDMGATPGQIDEVVKAKARYETKKDTEFSADEVTFRDSIMADAAKEGADLAEINAKIDARIKANDMTDTQGRSLAFAASDKIRAEAEKQGKDKSKLGDPAMLKELGGLYQQVKTGTADETSAYEQASAIAKKYGATDEDTKTIMGNMFSLDQGHKDKLRADAAAKVKYTTDQNASKAAVDRALAAGYGGSLLAGGNIDTVNDQGQKVEMSPKDYAIKLIKDKQGQKYSAAVQSGQMTKEQALPEMMRKVYLEMQQHDMIDPQMQAQLVAGLGGNIVDPKDSNKPKDGALQAYNAWLTLKNTPNMRPDYLSRTVGDDYTRSLLETAFKFDAGDMRPDQALLKAHEYLHRPEDERKVFALTEENRLKRNGLIREKLTTSVYPGFFQALVSNKNTLDDAGKQIMKNGMGVAQAYVDRRAEAYQMTNPNEDMDVSIEKAVQDLQSNSSIVAGNLITSVPGKELSKSMGLQDYGPTAVTDAVNAYVLKNGPTKWGAIWTDRTTSALSESLSTDGPHMGKNPDLDIRYNADMSTLVIDLWDAKHERTTGLSWNVPVKEISAGYIKERNSVTTVDKTWKSMFQTLGGLKKDMDDGGLEIPALPFGIK